MAEGKGIVMTEEIKDVNEAICGWSDPNKGVTFSEIIHALPKDERFQGTVYAMNTLLQLKGIYSPTEFEDHFRQWCAKHGSLEP